MFSEIEQEFNIDDFLDITKVKDCTQMQKS